MTETQRRAEIGKLLAKHAKESTVSREVARQTLIREGIYTRKGELRAEFGGPGNKAKRAK